MQPLMQNWPEIAARMRSAGSVALFVDFDGTLAPVTARPQDACMSRASRAALMRLAGNPHVKVWVISGRSWSDLRARVRVPGARYLGVQGWDTGQNAISPEVLIRMVEARLDLQWRLNGTTGVRIEDKGLSFALHYRGASQPSIVRARALLCDTLARHVGVLRTIPGDHAWEVLPNEVRGKGNAALRHWHRESGTLPVYLGNDGTDETAFQALASGVTASVGRPRRTKARYWLRSPVEVRQFLEMVEKEMRCQQQ